MLNGIFRTFQSGSLWPALRKVDSTLRERLLAAVRESYARYIASGPRSNTKIKILLGWVLAELREILNSEYTTWICRG